MLVIEGIFLALAVILAVGMLVFLLVALRDREP